MLCAQLHGSWHSRNSGRRLGGRSARGVLAGLAAAAALSAGGCAGDKVTALKTQQDFEAAIQASRPVLVDFYKAGCITCIRMDGTMDKLAEEYRDRATVAKFELMKLYFAATAPELQKRYDISFYPTVILFDGGKEVRRWILNYDIEPYREALNELLKKGSPASQPASRPASQPASRPATRPASRPAGP